MLVPSGSSKRMRGCGRSVGDESGSVISTKGGGEAAGFSAEPRRERGRFPSKRWHQ
jgi:hypothetical protein